MPIWGSTDGGAIDSTPESRGHRRRRPRRESALPPAQTWALGDEAAPSLGYPTTGRRLHDGHVPTYSDAHTIRRRDLLPRVIREKLQTMTNRGSESQQIRLLVRTFADFDHSDPFRRPKSGLVDAAGFCRALAEGLTLLGPREPEALRALFALHDDACLNVLDYTQFSERVVRGEQPPSVDMEALAFDSSNVDNASGGEVTAAAGGGVGRGRGRGGGRGGGRAAEERAALGRLRAALFAAWGAGALEKLRLMLWRADGGRGSLQGDKLLALLSVEGLVREEEEEEEGRGGGDGGRRALLRALGGEAHWSGEVATDRCLARLRTPMPRSRRQTVRDRFIALSSAGGTTSQHHRHPHQQQQQQQQQDRLPPLFVREEVLLAFSDPSAHPDVCSGTADEGAVMGRFVDIVRGSAIAGDNTAGTEGGGEGGAGAHGVLHLEQRRLPGSVSWFDFLEYHRDLSSGVEEDAAFSRAVEGMWLAPPPRTQTLLQTQAQAQMRLRKQQEQEQEREQEREQGRHRYLNGVDTTGCHLGRDAAAKRASLTQRGLHGTIGGRGTIPPSMPPSLSPPPPPPPQTMPADGTTRCYYYIHGSGNVPMEGVPMQPGEGIYGEPRGAAHTGSAAPRALLLDGVAPQYQEKKKERNNYRGVGLKPGEMPPQLCFKPASFPWRGAGASSTIPKWPQREA